MFSVQSSITVIRRLILIDFGTNILLDLHLIQFILNAVSFNNCQKRERMANTDEYTWLG